MMSHKFYFVINHRLHTTLFFFSLCRYVFQCFLYTESSATLSKSGTYLRIIFVGDNIDQQNVLFLFNILQ